MSNLPTIRQLRYFVSLAETRHFRRAAEAMGVSQPSLSLQIANLEALLGTPLVERGRGPVTLTPAGREVLTLARRTLDDAQEIVDVTAAMRGGLSGTIRLGVSPASGPTSCPGSSASCTRPSPTCGSTSANAPRGSCARNCSTGPRT
jgi:LysR family transcriptional regulator, hydrogen peroxide-inducible genes activator